MICRAISPWPWPPPAAQPRRQYGPAWPWRGLPQVSPWSAPGPSLHRHAGHRHARLCQGFGQFGARAASGSRRPRQPRNYRLTPASVRCSRADRAPSLGRSVAGSIASPPARASSSPAGRQLGVVDVTHPLPRPRRARHARGWLPAHRVRWFSPAAVDRESAPRCVPGRQRTLRRWTVAASPSAGAFGRLRGQAGRARRGGTGPSLPAVAAAVLNGCVRDCDPAAHIQRDRVDIADGQRA